MSVAGGPEEDGGLPPRMTLRVYTVDREGRITSDSGTHGFEGAEAESTRSPGRDFRPCACPHHRVMKAVR